MNEKVKQNRTGSLRTRGFRSRKMPRMIFRIIPGHFSFYRIYSVVTLIYSIVTPLCYIP